jgi:murein DD-endopeptidase MepM/ murein hydrolase activator NlpD
MDSNGKGYTILLIPGHNNGKTISIHCSRSALIILAVMGAVILLLAGFAMVSTYDALHKAHQLSVLRSDNEVLARENGQVKQLAQKIGKLDTLADYLQGLAESGPDVQTRSGAGVPPSPVHESAAAEGAPGAEDSIPTTPPVQGWVTQKFSNDTTRRGIAHPGIDIAADEGTPIVAAAPGRVSDAGLDRYYGNLITIDHGNGFTTRYGHCLKIFVTKGEHVARGQRIGLVGTTGFSSAPHLHYEVIKNGRNINPLGFIVAGKK